MASQICRRIEKTMSGERATFLQKLKWNLPWLVRYPFARGQELLSQTSSGPKHLVFTIANHFEPGWKKGGIEDAPTQLRRLEEYYKLARSIGESVRDEDGTKFRHTNFYPAEQYDRKIVDIAAAMQAEGLGDVEIHLHHGVEKPDTAENLRNTLLEFRDRLAGDHKCLSRVDGKGDPVYAFVHGNLALANSAGGRYCGVDSEMRILQETGCYVDMTLPSAPDRSQVPMLNSIYECGLPMDQAAPHRSGENVSVNGKQPLLPLIFTGPLVFNWTEQMTGLPLPRIDDGVLAHNQSMNLARIKRWMSANVIVKGQPEWIFIKLYCHGFIDTDQQACIGEEAKRFFSEMIEHGARTSDYKVYFASAREAYNMVVAAIDGKNGSPGEYRNYRLRSIMNEKPETVSAPVKKSVTVTS
jgi:hypothetical protein